MSDPVLSIFSRRKQLRAAFDDAAYSSTASTDAILDERAFVKMLCFERKRTERSHIRFVLMLLHFTDPVESGSYGQLLENVLGVLLHATRETDIKGWYETGRMIGVIFTGGGEMNENAISSALFTRIMHALSSTLSVEQIERINVSFHMYPEDAGNRGPGSPLDLYLYPELQSRTDRKRASRSVKRIVDILGSLVALIVLWPLFVAIAAAIKLTSEGPIFFQQERVGRYGRRFTFLKFRSMHVANDASIHKEYVTKLIANAMDGTTAGRNGSCTYKLTNDPRVTRVGKLLRRTSLDELPQFLNVLIGDMSLVGPRPPIPYEFACYDIWHKGRLLAVKPGITGLWQVGGRSRVKFDEMVRLDLKYARSWSVWLDLKILVKTPGAVLSGEGAY